MEQGTLAAGRARRRRVSRGAWPRWATMSPRSMKSSRSSVMPTERPAPSRPSTGVIGQLSTERIFAILPAGMMTISSPAIRLPDSMRPATIRRSSNL